MADLSAVLQALVAADQQAKANSPYAPVSQFTNQMTPTILQAAGSGQFKPGESIAAGLINGLVGGFSENLTNQYAAGQNDLAYQAMSDSMLGRGGARPEGMNPSVFAPIKAAGSVFSLGRGLDQIEKRDETNELLRREAAKAAMLNPEAAPQILETLNSIQTGQPLARAAQPVVQEDTQGDPLGIGPTYKSRFDDAMRQARSRGLTGNASLEYAQTLLKPEALANTQAEKTLTALREKLAAKEEVIQTAEAAISGAGETGGVFGGFRNLASRVAAGLGSDEQVDKQAYQKTLESLAPQIISMSRSAGVGAMSDREMASYLGAGPSADKTPEENRMLIDKLKSVASIENEYLDLLETAQATYGTTKGVDKIWREYKAANPLFINVEGQMVPNNNRPSWREFLENPNAKSAPMDLPGGMSVRAPRSAPIATQVVPSQDEAIAELQRRGLM